MDSELETIFSDWEILEKENIVYQENKKNFPIYLILSFLNLMAYCMRAIVDNFEIHKKKIDKQYYSIEDVD
jgi:hypothetical protein|tara:strand:- start:418 stop:630 length:213 start_codon:yes stop_codon:yes gene_type:complete